MKGVDRYCLEHLALVNRSGKAQGQTVADNR